MADTLREVLLTPPPDVEGLTIRRMTGNEEVGRMFEYTLELLGEDESIEFKNVLGKSMTIDLLVDGDNDVHRYFNGVVSRFSYVGTAGRLALYRATLRPWLWLLTQTSDCRIFQEKTVPDIIKEVFREHGFSDFDESLNGSYRTWEYCVQYRESDFNFVSRLMEQEGIYYYFRHEDGKHTLVLADDYASHEPVEGYDDVPYYPPGGETRRERDHIFDWSVTQQIRSGVYAINEYDFEKPKADLQVKSSISREHSSADMEVYDYPGEYVERGDGTNYVRLRIEEQQAQHERARGVGNARGLSPGALFNLSNHPRTDQNREYLLLTASYELNADPPETGQSTSGPVFNVAFSAMNAKEPHRSARITPKPVVQGPHTAVVVGKSGEEIWTDKYGRVKVQFHWDREGGYDENSSCWVRVSQNRAGANWGDMWLPHIGQEVIVEFLEGDPDRPIVTGRVYNADNMPPAGLPGAQTQSIIRDHGGNEIVMEGADGSQRITMYSPSHGTKMNLGAENSPDPGVWLETAANFVSQIGTDFGQYVAGNTTTETTGMSSWWVGGKTAYSFGGPVQWKWDGINVKTHAGANVDNFGGYKHSTHVGAKTDVNLAVCYSRTHGAKRTVDHATVIKDAADKDVNVKNNYTFDIGSKFDVDAGTEITLKCGGSELSITPDGVSINGKAVEIHATSGVIMAKASGDVKLSPGGKVNIPKGKLDDGGNIKS